MRRNFCRLVTISLAASALFLLVAIPNPVSAQPDKPRYVGEVIIMGNATIADCTILNAISLYPGRTFSDEDIRRAEENLTDLGLFVVDPEKGIRPRVLILSNGHESQVSYDILVRIEEKPFEERVWAKMMWITSWVIGATFFLGITWWFLRRWTGTET